jgi:hypothetical protein
MVANNNHIGDDHSSSSSTHLPDDTVLNDGEDAEEEDYGTVPPTPNAGRFLLSPLRTSATRYPLRSTPERMTSSRVTAAAANTLATLSCGSGAAAATSAAGGRGASSAEASKEGKSTTGTIVDGATDGSYWNDVPIPLIAIKFLLVCKLSFATKSLQASVCPTLSKMGNSSSKMQNPLLQFHWWCCRLTLVCHIILALAAIKLLC